MTPRKIVKPAYEDPNNSVDLFDASRENDFGEMYCVAPGILYEQIAEEWQRYLSQKTLKGEGAV